MFATYLAITLLASAANACAAYLNLTGHAYVRDTARRTRVPESWMVPLGVLLAAGALGLLAGLVVPVLGTLAGAGLVLYFLAALGFHLRARDHRLGGWAAFLALAVAALAVNLLHRTPW